MNALMKWLAKHADTLTESQKVAAKGAYDTGNEVSRLAETSHFLRTAAPKEQKDIDWFYKPTSAAAGKQYSKAMEDIRGTFGGPLQEMISHRDPRLQSFIDAVNDEQWGLNDLYNISDAPMDPRRHSFNYRKRED